MGTKHFIVMLIVAVASLLVGTCLIGFQVAPDAPTGAAARPDRRIGDQTPGGSAGAKAATWTPDVGHGLYSISVTLAHTDSQVQKFADFGLLLPTHLPDKSHLGNATLLWTPKEQKRLIQVEIR